MPKMKSVSSAKKRKRNLTHTAIVDVANDATVRKMLCI